MSLSCILNIATILAGLLGWVAYRRLRRRISDKPELLSFVCGVSALLGTGILGLFLWLAWVLTPACAVPIGLVLLALVGTITVKAGRHVFARRYSGKVAGQSFLEGSVCSFLASGLMALYALKWHLMSKCWKRILLLLFTAIFCMIVWHAYAFVKKKTKNSCTKQDVDVWPTFALGVCVLVAIFVDERVVKLFPLPDSLKWLYEIDYAFKWELMALVAAGVITARFWFEELKGKNDIDGTYFRRAMTALLFTFIALWFAVTSLFSYAKIEHTAYEWKYLIFARHFFFAWLLSVLFLVFDYSLWKGVTDPKQYKIKNAAELFYFLADWPIVLSLSLLGMYYGTHWLEHKFLGPLMRELLHIEHHEISNIDMWNSEVYFMSGAIAFQYLLSAGFYIALSWKLVKLVDANQHMVDVALEKSASVGTVDPVGTVDEQAVE